MHSSTLFKFKESLLFRIIPKLKRHFQHSFLLQTFLRLNTRMKSLATKVISLSIVRKKKPVINKIKSKTKIVALFVSNHFQIQTMWRNTLNTSMKKLNIFIVICAVALFIILITWEGITRVSMRQKWALICQNTQRVRNSAQM